ncbi:hypothetical protein [Micromonospora sp. KC721]|uniref:hypothetical protein n=1 Tax=Micromonospora sp. KC721 TaxID=2530380 RepID=UPI001404ECD1|nr:hypothetical protein [Micromonospora sp. KC721]
MTSTRARVVRTVLTLTVVAGLAAGCQGEEKGSAPAAAGSASTTPSPTVDAAANSKQVCEASLALVKKHFIAMANDAIAAIDKPVSAEEAGGKVRANYTAIAEGLRTEAPKAAEPQVRTALENLAGAIEKRLTGPNATKVESPDLDPTLEALDAACRR